MKSLGNRLLHGGAVALVGKSLVAIGMVLVNALVARLLTPEETGLFFLALSMVTVAAVVADFGFGKTLLRLIPDAVVSGDNGLALSHVRHILVVAVISILVTALLLVSPAGVWIAGKLSHGVLLGSLMPMVALWLAVTVILSLLAESYRGFHYIAEAIIYGGALTGLGNIIIVAAVLAIALTVSYSSSLGQVMLLFVLSGTILSTIAIVRLFRRFRDDATGAYGRPPVGRLLRVSWPFWVSGMALVLLTNAEIWVLGLVTSPEEVAAYGLVAKLALLVNFPLVIVNNVLPPMISELYAKKDMIKMERMLRASAGITTLCSGLVFGLLFIAGEGLSRLLFGAYFSGNWDIMMILSVGWLFHVWAGSGGFVLNMTDNQKSVMVISIFSGAVTLVLGYWLTSRYGGLGMAIASSIGLLLVNSLMLIRIRKKLGIRIYAGMSGVTEVINDISRRLQAVR